MLEPVLVQQTLIISVTVSGNTMALTGPTPAELFRIILSIPLPVIQRTIRFMLVATKTEVAKESGSTTEQPGATLG